MLIWILIYWTGESVVAHAPGGRAGRLSSHTDIHHFSRLWHGSFFKSRLANDITGFVAGVLTFTPCYHWRWEHALHHGSSGDLDRRGTGDVWTLTVQEYLESSRCKRFAYRLARNPIVLFVIAPVFLFVVRERFPSPKAGPRERHSVWWMNGAILAMVTRPEPDLRPPSVSAHPAHCNVTAGAAGVWMFYVQHQFEDAYWERSDERDYTTAAFQGSSFYKLPRILQWLSGNIGFHHIHHLSPHIANYNLERCHNSHPLFRNVKPVTLFGSLKSINFRLWDEERHRLVGFRRLRELQRKRSGK